MEKRQFKDRIYTELAKISSAIGNPHRLEILDLLAQGEKSVETISKETGMSVANTSQHLQVLKLATLVETRREGNFIYYKVSSPKVEKLWMGLKDLGLEKIAEIEKLVKDFRTQRMSLESITIDQLIKRIKSNDVTIIDVRPKDEFLNGHIPGALSIPIEQLQERIKKLPKSKQIVAYCRGPFCVFADDAIKLLMKNKFKAIRLNEGFPEWKNKGLPVEINY